MKKIFDKIKELPVRKRNVLVGAVGAVAFVFLILGEFAEDEEIVSPYDDTARYAAEYVEETEEKLCRLIESIDGAGETEVMITLESCYENVYAKGNSVSEDIDDVSADRQLSEEYIVIKSGSNTEECVVIKVYEPVIKGVAVSAEGADNSAVKKAITETVCALFDISSNKVSVIKKYEE